MLKKGCKVEKVMKSLDFYKEDVEKKFRNLRFLDLLACFCLILLKVARLARKQSYFYESSYKKLHPSKNDFKIFENYSELVA